MSHLQTTCPNCKKMFKAAPDALGKKTRCKKCDTLFLITVGVGSPVDSDPDPFSIDFPADAPKLPPAAAAPTVTTPPKTPESALTQNQADSRQAASQAAATSAAKAPLSPYEAFAQQASGNTPADENGYLDINRKLHHQGQNVTAGGRSSEGLVFRGTGMMLFGMFLFGLAFSGMHIQHSNLVSPVGALIGVGIGALGAIFLMSGIHRRFLATLMLGVIPLVLFLGGGGLVAYLLTIGYWGSGGSSTLFAGINQPEALDPNDQDANGNDQSDNPIEQPQKLAPRPAEVIPGGGGRRDNAANPVQQQPVEQPATPNPPFVDKIRTPEGIAAAMVADVTRSPSWSDRDRVDSIRQRANRITRQIAAKRFNTPDSIPLDWLSDSVGKMQGRFDHYMASFDNLPAIGLDTKCDTSGNGFSQIIPVYDSTDDSVSIAKPGFALGGLNIYYRNGEVRGIQCVFMSFDQGRLHGEDIYFGNWVGSKPDNPDRMKSIDSDGQTVVGVYYEGSPSTTAIGLIRKPR